MALSPSTTDFLRSNQRAWYGRGRGHLTDEDINELPRGDQLKKKYLLIGNQVSINNDTFHTLLYYSVIGHILKDGVQVFWGKKHTGFRHFVSLVGATSIGKSEALFNAVGMLHKFQTFLLNLPFTPRIDPDIACIYPTALTSGSPEGIADNIRKYNAGPFLYTEEFGKFFEKGKSYMEGFDETMINIIDGKPIKSVTIQNPYFIAHPQVSYINATTPERFLNPEYPIARKYSNGFLGRGIVYYHDVDRFTRDQNEKLMEKSQRYNTSTIEEEIMKSFTALYTLNHAKICPTWGIEVDEEGIEIIDKTRDKLRELTENSPIFEGALTRNLQYAMKWAGIDTIMNQLSDMMFSFATPGFFANGFKTHSIDFVEGEITVAQKTDTKVDKKTGQLTKTIVYIPRAVETTRSLLYKVILNMNNSCLKEACNLLEYIFETTVTLFYSSTYNDRIDYIMRELSKSEGLISESQLLTKSGWIADKDYKYLVNTLFRRGELIPINMMDTNNLPTNYLCDHSFRSQNNKCSTKDCPIGNKCKRWNR